MEKLKFIEDILTEDPRFAKMMTAGREENEPEHYSFQQHYKRYAMLMPPEHASEQIVSGLVTAQHLAIYSWFVFPFSTAAELQAIATLEHAIRRVMFNKTARGLKMRLRDAVKEGLITGKRLKVLDPFIVPVSAVEFANREIDQDGVKSLEIFISNLPEQRNWLAHGNWVPGGDSFMVLDIVFQLVQQLYSRS